VIKIKLNSKDFTAYNPNLEHNPNYVVLICNNTPIGCLSAIVRFASGVSIEFRILIGYGGKYM